MNETVWIDKGACREYDYKLWFPESENAEQNRQDTEKAVLICNSCPVVLQCREYAMEKEAFGTWGGLPEETRELMRHRNGQPFLMSVKVRERSPKLRNIA